MGKILHLNENEGTEKDFLTQPECDDLARIMTIKHGPSLGQKRFSIRCSEDEQGVFAEVVLSDDNESFYYPVKGRYHKSGDLSSKHAASLMLDYIDLYFEDYLNDDSVLLQLDWGDHVFEGEAFQLKGQVINKKLDRLADELLSESTHQETL